MSTYQLPYQDSRGFTNCLLCAIGGDGANMAAKLLFKLGAKYLNLDGAYDARYGSEKKGTPTDVSLKFCYYGTPVLESGPNNRPHILVVFREELILTQGLNRGLQENATVIVNTTKSADEIRDMLQLHSGAIYTLDAMKIAEETKSRLNMPMMAMLAHVLGFPEDDIKHAIEDTWPRAVKPNIAAYEQAVASSSSKKYAADGKYALVPPVEVRGRLGYDNMLDGGAIDTAAHSTVSKNNAHVRFNEPPSYSREICIDCAKCLVVCADPGSIKWADGKMVGIDLTYCKGCMRCVSVCPETKRGKALTNPALKEVEA